MLLLSKVWNFLKKVPGAFWFGALAAFALVRLFLPRGKKPDDKKEKILEEVIEVERKYAAEAEKMRAEEEESLTIVAKILKEDLEEVEAEKKKIDKAAAAGGEELADEWNAFLDDTDPAS